MSFKLSSILILACFITASAIAQTGTSDASKILSDAYKKAAKENKNIFIIFHASWCGWCHKMDSSMNDRACSKFFRDNYVVCHLTVDESKDKKNLETPGAEAIRAKYHGDQAGLPFWLIMDKDGNLLADSRMPKAGAAPDEPGDNIGCPASREEVAYFIKLLKKTSSLDDDQLQIIQERFNRNNE